MKNWLGNIVLLAIVTAAITLPVFWSTRNLFFRLFSDYDALLPVYQVITESFRGGLQSLQNPYIAYGIPFIGDPLSGFGNPFLYIPLILFGIPVGMRVVIFEVIVLSGISMFWLLQQQGISRNVKRWGALCYMTSGALYAKIVAGHWEQIFAYPVVPLVIALGLSGKLGNRRIMLLSMILAFTGYAGAWYHLWYMFLLLGVLRLFLAPRSISGWAREFGVLFSVLSGVTILMLPKVYDFIVHINPVFLRQIPDSAAGSLHLPLFVLPFIVPFQVSFYDRPVFQHWLGFYYNWYEYYAFISPLPLLFLRKLWQISMRKDVRALALIVLVGALYVSKKFPYSPFYWLDTIVPALQVFRVPQRIYMVLLAPLVCLLALCFDYWLKTEKRVLIKQVLITAGFLSLVWNTLLARQTLLAAFEAEPTSTKAVIEQLANRDKSTYYVGSLVCCTQWYLIEHHLPVINYYYGWFHKDAPRYFSEGGRINTAELARVRPKYLIISTGQMNDVAPWYSPFVVEGTIAIVVTEHPNIQPSL